MVKVDRRLTIAASVPAFAAMTTECRAEFYRVSYWDETLPLWIFLWIIAVVVMALCILAVVVLLARKLRQ